jgi:hypothetical protein
MVYITAKPVYTTKRKGSWRPDDVNSMLDATREKYGESGWHKALSNYNKEDVKPSTKNPVSTILAVAKQKIHWTTQGNYDKAYGEYSDKLRNLRMSYGVARDSDGMLGDNRNQRQDMGGMKASQNGNLIKDFNMASAVTEKYTMYEVDANGHIVGEIPGEAINAMSALPKAAGPEKAVAEKLKPEEIEAYMKAKAELDSKFKGKTYNLDSMLAISANVNGVSYYYINDKAIISGKNAFNVNPQELIAIAEESIGQKFEPITGFAN